jgi:hypothetical protein
MAIICGRSGHSHDTVAQVKACQLPAEPTKELQMAGAPKGLREFEVTKHELGYAAARTGPVIKAAKPKSFSPENLEDGFYLHNMIVYKVIVAVHGSGKKYAKKLDISGSWIYAAGAIKLLRPEHKMNLEQALTIGKIYSKNVDSRLYGRCFRCGRTLTDETSIGRGIGPDCYGKF